MPVYTIMADKADGEPTQLHTHSTSEASSAQLIIQGMKRNGRRNIRVYVETQRIDEAELERLRQQEARSPVSPPSSQNRPSL